MANTLLYFTEFGKFGANYITVAEDLYCLRQKCIPKNLLSGNDLWYQR